MLDKGVYKKMKYLQKETGAGMFWCRKVLHEFNYDDRKAIEYLKSKQFENIKNHGIK